jgi:magnesium chelatase family protein
MILDKMNHPKALEEESWLLEGKTIRKIWKEICNSSVPFEQLIGSRPITSSQRNWIQNVSMKYGLSNRVQIKIIRMARTISDMRGEQSITDVAIEEALAMRRIGK